MRDSMEGSTSDTTSMGTTSTGGTSNRTSTGTSSGTAPSVALLTAPKDRDGKYVEVNGARIFYQVSGQGQPILLLHGYPLSGALFARNRDALSTRFMVITLDHRGYGNSKAPGVPDSVETYAKDALDVMTELGVHEAIIGGHSMGGPITFEMYRRAPERFSGMILIDTIAKPAAPIEEGLWKGFAEQSKKKGVDSLVDPLMKDMLTGDTRTNQPEQVDYLTKVIEQCSQDAAIGGAKTLAGRPDSTDLLAQINVPTLVYVGVEDSIYPVKGARMMQEAIPNSTLATIPGGSHASVFEKPDQTNQVIMDWANKI